MENQDKIAMLWQELNEESLDQKRAVRVKPIDVLVFPHTYGHYRPEGLPVVNDHAFIPEALLARVRDLSNRPDEFWDRVVIFCDRPELGHPIIGFNLIEVTPWVPHAFIPLN